MPVPLPRPPKAKAATGCRRAAPSVVCQAALKAEAQTPRGLQRAQLTGLSLILHVPFRPMNHFQVKKKILPQRGQALSSKRD